MRRSPLRKIAPAFPALLLTGAVLLLPACRSHPTVTGPANGPRPPRANPAAPTNDRFARARLWKPPDAPTTQGWSGLLAPLILEEVIGTEPAPGTPTPHLRMFAHEESIFVGGRLRPQIFYLWRQEEASTSGRHPPPPWQGIRILLGSRDLPILWETAGTVVPRRHLYVARHWEEAAARRWGPPAPPRRFAVETPAATQPHAPAFVTDIFDDAPMPMGPIVHITADGRIASLICRCSPARVQRLSSQLPYELQPLSAALTMNHLDPVPVPGSAAWLTAAQLETLLHWLPDL